MSSNETLKDHVDLTGNAKLEHLIASKRAMKTRVDNLLSEQKQIDNDIKEIVGDYQSFTCGDENGTFRYEERKEYTVKASSPRVLRLL